MDLEKAFDSLDHDFLICVLKKIGFGDNFITWIKILLNDQQSCVLNGGLTTQYFKLERGARQGDPISISFYYCFGSSFDFNKKQRQHKRY